MSDCHEMFEEWSDLLHDYDPDYPIDGGKDDDEENLKPVNPDDWADEDLEGGF